MQCLASLIDNDPVADVGIFMEDLCIGVKDHKKLTNPFDKNGFFECLDGQSIEKVCPGKRAFNPILEKCLSDIKSRYSSEARAKRRQMSSIASKYHLLPKSLQTVSTKKSVKVVKKTTSKKPVRFVRGMYSLCQCMRRLNHGNEIFQILKRFDRLKMKTKMKDAKDR